MPHFTLIVKEVGRTLNSETTNSHVDNYPIQANMYDMSIAVMFRKVSYSDVLYDFSCEITAGERALIVTAGEEESTALSRLLSGFIFPEQGSIIVSGNSTAEATSEQLLQARTRLGIIAFQGGLVSNLKTWENIFLPYYYHTGKPEPEVDELASNYLKKLNCSGKHLAFPAHLSLFEKRAAAFVRAAIMQPDIMIYCNTLERISMQDQRCFASVLNDFHTAKAGRTSIYLASTTELPVQLNFSSVIYLHPQQKNSMAVT